MSTTSDRSDGGGNKSYQEEGSSTWLSSTCTSLSSSAASSSARRSRHSGNVENEIKSRIRISHSESARNANLDSLEMNKLRFGNLGLHGRKKEMDILKVCFDRLVTAESDAAAGDGKASAELVAAAQNEEVEDLSFEKTEIGVEGGKTSANAPNKSSEVVFISGESGTGKVSRRYRAYHVIGSLSSNLPEVSCISCEWFTIN